MKNNNNNNNHHFMAIVQVSLCYPAPPVKNWRIFWMQNFTTRMTLLAASSTCTPITINVPVILPSLVGAKSNNFVILVGCVQVVSDVASDFSDAFCAWL